MEAVDFSGVISKADVPVCLICGMPITVMDEVALAQAEGRLFIVHWQCADFEFFNA